MKSTIIQVPNQVLGEFLTTVTTLNVISGAIFSLELENELYTSYRLTASNTKECDKIARRLKTVINDIEGDYVLYGC